MYFLMFKDHKWSLPPLYEFVLKYLSLLLARFRIRLGGVPIWIKLIIWALLQGESLPSFLSYGMIAMVEMKPCQHALLLYCFVLLRVRRDWLWKAIAEAQCLSSLPYCGQLVGSDTNLSLILVLHCNNMPAVPCILLWYCNVIIFLLSLTM